MAIDESWAENYGDGVRDGPNIPFTVAPGGNLVTFSYDATSHMLTVSQAGAREFDLRRQKAHWLARDVLAWNPAPGGSGASYSLHYAIDGGLAGEEDGITGGETIALQPTSLPDSLKAKYPHLASLQGFQIAPRICRACRRRCAGSSQSPPENAAGEPVDATGVQIPGVLDDLYANDAELGASFAAGAPTQWCGRRRRTPCG